MNPAVVVGIFTLLGVVIGNLMQIYINARTNAHQLERDRQAALRTFRLREYERIREACEQLASSNRDRLAAVRTMKDTPRGDNQLAEAAVQRAILDANQALRILGVETRADALRDQYLVAQDAVRAYWRAIGVDRSVNRASDDEIKLREVEAGRTQQMLEQSVYEYLTQLRHTLGLVEHRTS